MEGDHAYSPFAPEKPAPIPPGGSIIGLSDCAHKKDRVSLALPLEAGEAPVAVAHDSLGSIPQATVVLVQGESPGDKPLDVQLAPKSLRVFDGNREIARVAVDMAAFPCVVIVDNLDGEPGNEIALVWASVAAGYTIGVTVFTNRPLTDQ